jgi:hypothetical protein
MQYQELYLRPLNFPPITDSVFTPTNRRIERQAEKLQLMRRSNFHLKSQIDVLYDVLQTQKEKHHDLKQELNRMLTDIQ